MSVSMPTESVDNYDISSQGNFPFPFSLFFIFVSYLEINEISFCMIIFSRGKLKLKLIYRRINLDHPHTRVEWFF